MVFIKIVEYILLPKNDRQRHLDLTELCIEIGGSSYQFKGLLCHTLKTTLPTKADRVLLCHACHNEKCSNPRHLYWGTHKENYHDAMDNGQRTIHQKCVHKYGEEHWRQELKSRGNKNRASQLGKLYGGRNKLSPLRLKEIEEVLKGTQVGKWGWQARAAKNLNLSHTQIKRIVKNYFPGLIAPL